MESRNKIAKTLLKRLPGRLGSAFTMIELMVVVTIIGILAATAMANYIQTQDKAKKAGIMDNMHSIQVASEAYATDTSGLYAAGSTGLSPYLPGGQNSIGGTAGKFPTNPYTGVINETPYVETISDSATIQAVRTSAPTASPGTVGQVGYNQCDAPEDTSYCVTGCAEGGLRVGGADSTLVLSNH